MQLNIVSTPLPTKKKQVIKERKISKNDPRHPDYNPNHVRGGTQQNRSHNQPRKDPNENQANGKEQPSGEQVISDETEEKRNEEIQEKIEAKKKLVKKIIKNRRDKLTFVDTEAQEMAIPKSNDLIDESCMATIDNVFSEVKFSELGLERGVLKSIEKMGFERLTKIQLEIFQAISQRKNTIVRSVTGSGKTLAYMVPIMNDLLTLGTKISRNDGLYVLVLAPTRELCGQIYEVCVKMCFGCVNIVPCKMVGGETINHEKSRLRKGVNILVCTPARLLYHLENSKNLNISNLRTIVFEESDLTLSMGQGNNVKSLIAKVHALRADHYLQKIFTTACYDSRVKDLMDSCMVGDFALVGGLDIEARATALNDEEMLIPEQLNQNYVIVEENNKLSYLLCILHYLQDTKMIIFVSTADQANFLEKIIADIGHLPPRKFEENYVGKGAYNQNRIDALEELNKTPKILKLNVLKLHGHIDQIDRAKVYTAFSKLKVGVLISTDVGSRGLDFDNVKLIILYDPPESLAHYSNRVGRTARLTKVGSSLLFLHPVEDAFVKVLNSRYTIKEYDPTKSFESLESSVPKYYPVYDSIEYLNHAIKKVGPFNPASVN